MKQLDEPNVVLPLAASYNTRGAAAFTNAFTNALDQRKINSVYEPVENQATGKTTLYLVKRAGVLDNALTFGASGQVAYLIEKAAGSTTNDSAESWVFSTLTNDVRASNSVTTTTIVTAAGYVPRYVDKTAISNTDTVVLQIANTSGDQRFFYSSDIATWTEITDADFTARTHVGKMEFMDGYAFYLDTAGRIYNSDLNSLSAWGASSYITKQVMQDIPRGLAKLGNQVIAFGHISMEIFQNAGNPVGSPLVSRPELFKRVGLSDTTILNVRHYYTVIKDTLYFVGDGFDRGVWAYNGSELGKVSNIAIDKMLSEIQVYHVGQMAVRNIAAVTIALDAPTATTQRWLVYVPAWKEWFEWNSTVFSPVTMERAPIDFLGVGSNQHKTYYLDTAANGQDAGTNFQFLHQFQLPKNGSARKFMRMCGLVGDTARSALSLAVEFSDDDGQAWSTARNIDMTAQKKNLYRIGSYQDGRQVRLSYTGSLELRLEKFLARID